MGNVSPMYSIFNRFSQTSFIRGFCSETSVKAASQMFYKALLLLFPAVVYARINIDAVAGIDTPFFSLEVWNNGTIEDVISDRERITWKIYDEALKSQFKFCASTRGWPRPDNVFVRSPTPGDDLYKTNNKKQVHRILKSKGREDWPMFTFYNSIPMTSKPVILATENIYNDNNITVKYTDKGKFNQSVEETLYTTWSTDYELTVNDKDQISFEFSGRQWDAPDFYFTGSWGKNQIISKTASIVNEPGLSVELEPGELAVVALVASRHTLEFKVEFVAYLEGVMVLNYANKFKGQHYYFRDVNDHLNKCSIHREVVSDVKIKIVFYDDAHITVSKNLTPVQHKQISKTINFDVSNQKQKKHE